MSRRQLFWVALVFVLVLLAALLLKAPVVHALRWVQIPAGVAITGVSGDLLDIRVSSIQVQNVVVDNLLLSLNPGCFLSLKLCYQFETSSPRASGELALNAIDQSVELRDSRIEVPSELWANSNQMLVKPTGEFNLFIQNLTLQGQRIDSLDGRLTWASAGVQGEDQVLGNYTAQLSRVSEGLNIELSDQDSALSMTGNALISSNGQFKTQIRLSGSPGLNRSIYSVLDLLGQKTAATKYSVNKTGILPRNVLPSISQLLAAGE